MEEEEDKNPTTDTSRLQDYSHAEDDHEDKDYLLIR
jgi:hypothetical protein